MPRTYTTIISTFQYLLRELLWLENGDLRSAVNEEDALKIGTGDEKVRRMRRSSELCDHMCLHASGDTRNSPMLVLNTDPHYGQVNVSLGKAETEREADVDERMEIMHQGASKVYAMLLLALVGIGALLVHQAFKPITETVAQGTYTREWEAFPRYGDWPVAISFLPGHRVKLEDTDGKVRYEGPWHWDQDGASLRLGDPVWDRRVRWVPGWTGPVLKVTSPVGRGIYQSLTFNPL